MHLFWGALDLAVTRFSGRPRRPVSGRRAELRTLGHGEAYSHEVSSAGYWPGPDGEGVLLLVRLSRARRIPLDAMSRPRPARLDDALGEFTLPYDVVRTAPDPDAVLLEFLQTHLRSRSERGSVGPRRLGALDALEDDDRDLTVGLLLVLVEAGHQIGLGAIQTVALLAARRRVPAP